MINHMPIILVVINWIYRFFLKDSLAKDINLIRNKIFNNCLESFNDFFLLTDCRILVGFVLVSVCKEVFCAQSTSVRMYQHSYKKHCQFFSLKTKKMIF